jgi:hypothetical protein
MRRVDERRAYRMLLFDACLMPSPAAGRSRLVRTCCGVTEVGGGELARALAMLVVVVV